MKLCELIRKYNFDTVAQVLVAKVPGAESQLAWYKQAYDTLLMETMPAGESSDIEVVRGCDEKADGTIQDYVYARHCEGQPWDCCLASEVVIEEGISEPRALASILWGITFYGYTKEERARVYGEAAPRNVYERKAEVLRQHHFLNYAYGLAGDFEIRHRSLSWEDWEIFKRRKAHRNRAKRMRDARQKRSVAWLDHAGSIQASIDCFHANDRDKLEYLFDTHKILELKFRSHVQVEGKRDAYIAELLTKYYRGDLSVYTRCEILCTTSASLPLSVDEHLIIDNALSALMPQKPVMRYWMQADEGLGENLSVYLILSQ